MISNKNIVQHIWSMLCEYLYIYQYTYNFLQYAYMLYLICFKTFICKYWCAYGPKCKNQIMSASSDQNKNTIDMKVLNLVANVTSLYDDFNLDQTMM